MQNATELHTRDQWTGKLGFILSLTGAAVGLGNIWRFPYLLSEGGCVFLLMYALCMFILVLPIMFFEIKMGQMMRAHPIASFSKLCAKYQVPKFFVMNAYLGLLIVFAVLTFYTIVAGWVIHYLLNSILNPPANSLVESQQLWDSLVSNPIKIITFNFIFLLCNFFVLTRGVKKGLEMLNRFMLPGLVAVLLFMIGFAAFSNEMVLSDALKLMFSIEISDFNTKNFLSALGQALFTLAVGACAILTYGAYLPKDEKNIVLSANVIIITQLVISVALGVVIYSLLLSNGSSEVINASGPELIFVVLPVFFAKTAIPQILTTLFFVITFFAAITSSVNIAEPMVYTLTNKFKVSRVTASIFVIFATLASSTLLAASFKSNYDFFGTLIHLVTEIAMPISAFIFAILAGWFVDRTFLKEMIIENRLSSTKNIIFYKFARFSTRFLFPIALALTVAF